LRREIVKTTAPERRFRRQKLGVRKRAEAYRAEIIPYKSGTNSTQ
jgi:hypothetical protein